MKKKLYVQPDVRVTALRVTNRLMAGSLAGLGGLNDYGEGGDPFSGTNTTLVGLDGYGEGGDPFSD